MGINPNKLRGNFIDENRRPTKDDVDTERDRRISVFQFEGVVYQLRSEDRENIAGAKSAAKDAIDMGAQQGEINWQQRLDPNAPEEFHWIAADNSIVPMDAFTTVRFGYTAMTHKQAHIFAARVLKDMEEIPFDFAVNPAYWPENSFARPA